MNWTEHDDELEFEGFAIKSNYHTWTKAKSQLVKRHPFNAPFYIQTENAAGLTLSEAKRLRDYLSEKITYLESK